VGTGPGPSTPPSSKQRGQWATAGDDSVVSGSRWWAEIRDAWRESSDEGISGITSNGSMKTVEADPLLELALVQLSMDRMVPIEPVGERVEVVVTEVGGDDLGLVLAGVHSFHAATTLAAAVAVNVFVGVNVLV
jgi:hypothetical protein